MEPLAPSFDPTSEITAFTRMVSENAALMAKVEVKETALREMLATIDTLSETVRQQRLMLDAQPRGRTLKNFLRDLLSDADKDCSVDDIDEQKAYERLTDLVSGDDHEVWSPEKEYEVTVGLTIRVTGTVKARSKAHAVELVQDDPPSVDLDSDGALSGAYLSDTTVDDVESDDC